jgi:Domain of unknown function (DUF4389)
VLPDYGIGIAGLCEIRDLSSAHFLYSLRMAYPVLVSVEPALANRNRLTTAFRLILAIPHIILVGGVGFGVASRGDSATILGGEGGLLGAVAAVLAIVSWFTIVIGGTHIVGIRQFTSFYMRWRVRALSYLMLLRDEYPPFGDEPYPASIEIVDPVGPRDRLTVGLRILLAIPHFIALFFLLLAWWLTTIAAWLIILFTSTYPQGLYEFGSGALGWLLRVEAYVLLLVDEYPPFSLT